MKQRAAILFLILALLLTACAGELTPQERISRTLEALGASDAQTDTVYTNSDFLDPDDICYSSDSAQLVYSFAADTGYLHEVIHYSLTDPDYEEPETEVAPVLTDAQRQELVLTFAADCLCPNQIGDLQIASEHFSNIDYTYQITETYDGMETGTQMMIICSPEGQIQVCVLHVGTIFEKNMFGSYSLVEGDDFITGETAIQTALEFVEEQAAEKGDTVLPDTAVSEIKARKDEQYYLVSIDTQEPGGYIVTYDVHADVHTGEILFYQFTQ